MNLLQGLLPALAAAAVAFGGGTAARAWPAEVVEEVAIREGPDLRYTFIVVVPEGTIVDVVRCSDVDEWCRVFFDGAEGFVRRRFLDRIGDDYVGSRIDLYWDVMPRYRGPGHPRYISRPPGRPEGDYRPGGRQAVPGRPLPDGQPSRGPGGLTGPPGRAPAGQEPPKRGQLPSGRPPTDLPGGCC